MALASLGCHCCDVLISAVLLGCCPANNVFVILPVMDQPHRKLVKHYHEPGDVHELTFSCYQRRQLLTNDVWSTNLAESIDRANRRHKFGLLAYVFMPEHVHLLLVPLTPVVNLPRLLSDIKRSTSLKIKRHLIACQSPLLDQLTIQQRPGVLTFRFWQEGPGYDRNLNNPSTIEASIDYIHENPFRRGLCLRAVDWKWSSAGRLLGNRLDLSTPPALCRIDVHQGSIVMPEGQEHC